MSHVSNYHTTKHCTRCYMTFEIFTFWYFAAQFLWKPMPFLDNIYYCINEKKFEKLRYDLNLPGIWNKKHGRFHFWNTKLYITLPNCIISCSELSLFAKGVLLLRLLFVFFERSHIFTLKASITVRVIWILYNKHKASIVIHSCNPILFGMGKRKSCSVHDVPHREKIKSQSKLSL